MKGTGSRAVIGAFFALAALFIPVFGEGAAAPARKLAVFPSGHGITSSPFILSGGREYSPIKWFGYQDLVVDLENRGKVPSAIAVSLSRRPGNPDWGNHIGYSGTLAPGKRAKWRIPILYLAYSRAHEWPNQGEITGVSSDGSFNPPLEVGQVAVALSSTMAGQAVKLYSISLAGPHPKKGWIDEFGQRCCMDWTNKVRDEGQLASADKREKERLRETPKNVSRDKYQGWIAHAPLRGTGFFRVENVNGTWWMVDPAGNLFFSQGMDCVDGGIDARMDGTTRPAYSRFPPKKGKFAPAWSPAHGAVKNETDPLWPSFHRANQARKWGASWEIRGRERAIARLLDWGFTTIGNWSDPKLLEMKRMPYVSHGPDTWKLWDKVTYAAPNILDPFHPKFEQAARELCMADLAVYRADPWLVCHFLENEIAWGAVPHNVMGLADDAPAKAWLVADLKKTYGNDIKELNKAWGISATSFESIPWPEEWEWEPTPEAKRDMGRYMGEFSDRWYGAWARGIRSADPNHLLLGDRYAYDVAFDEVLVSCARYMDVVSVNCYDWDFPRGLLDGYYRLAGKPILIGEYGFNSLDNGTLTSAIPVANEEERGAGYRWYTERACAAPYIVGLHYFQYWDEPITGRFDRETSFNGFVRVTDIPYNRLVDSARVTNGRIYRLHAGEVTPTERQPKR